MNIRAPWVRFVEGFASAEPSVVSGGSSAPAESDSAAAAPGGSGEREQESVAE